MRRLVIVMVVLALVAGGVTVYRSRRGDADAHAACEQYRAATVVGGQSLLFRGMVEEADALALRAARADEKEWGHLAAAFGELVAALESGSLHDAQRASVLLGRTCIRLGFVRDPRG